MVLLVSMLDFRFKGWWFRDWPQSSFRFPRQETLLHTVSFHLCSYNATSVQLFCASYNRPPKILKSFNSQSQLSEHGCNVFLTFGSINKILWCDHSNEMSSAVLLHGTICF